MRPSPRQALSRRGASLFELTLTIGIILVVTTGIFVTSKLVDRSAARREAEAAAQLIGALHRIHEMPHGHYTEIASTPLELVPPRLVADGHLRTRWGPIELQAEDVLGRRNAGFIVRFLGVPDDQCQDFVQGLPRGSRQFVVGHVAVTTQAGLDRHLLAQACSASRESKVSYHHFTGAAGDPRL